MSYQVIFCLWLLTFEQDVAAQINRWVTCFSTITVITEHYPQEF